MSHALRAYLVDDKPSAIRNLARVLKETGRVEVVGSSTSPVAALAQIPTLAVDVLFVDIEMPALDGFMLLERLTANPQVVFVTGHNEYAEQAFETRAVDYLLKPVRRPRLLRALDKLEARRADPEREGLRGLLERLAGYRVPPREPLYADRITVHFAQQGLRLIDVGTISRLVARGKGTIAVTEDGECLVEHMLGELERRLDPRKFLRIHRGVLVNLDWVESIRPPVGGGLVVRMKDREQTELEVPRERVRDIKGRFVL